VRQWLRSHLTYANVVATLALLIAVGSGSAYAANQIFSSDIADNQVFSVDVRNDSLPGGGLTGADIRNHSNVDTCTHGTVRLGELCFKATNSDPQGWNQALGECATLGLRLPSFSEAVALARYDLPNLSDQELFWTDDYFFEGTPNPRSLGVSDGGGYLDSDLQSTYRTACVTTPTN
jgi:hypothetical protein